jgi:hypothetical protein
MGIDMKDPEGVRKALWNKHKSTWNAERTQFGNLFKKLWKGTSIASRQRCFY